MDFIGNLNLNEKNCYQVCYSSQLYGTFFSVFAKFDCVKNGKDYTLNKIEFKVINYKGILDIGIVNVSGFAPGTKNHTIKLEVKAMGGNQDITFNCAGQIVKENDWLIIERTLLPIHNNTDPIRNNVFDDEFFYREGLHNGNYDQRQPAPNSAVGAKMDMEFFGGSICPRSTNYIL